eukprot:scaffold21891_cov90-Isochrysis_galbana.AAC.1
MQGLTGVGSARCSTKALAGRIRAESRPSPPHPMTRASLLRGKQRAEAGCEADTMPGGPPRYQRRPRVSSLPGCVARARNQARPVRVRGRA